MKVILISILGIVLFAIIMFPALMLDAWVLTVLWEWFAVPVGLPQITYATAMGLILLMSFLTHQYIPKEKNDWQPLVFLYVNPFVFLFFGWLVKLFIG